MYVEVSTKETDSFNQSSWSLHRAKQRNILYYHIYLQSMELFVTQIAKIQGMRIPLSLEWARMLLPEQAM